MDGKKLRELREARGLSLRELATLSGVSKSTISELENGIGGSTTTTLKKLAKALKCKPEDLL